ncbi:hypothetical protein JG688_00003083 [Phytophthora aleatoria]|uniref:Uncharacterized protein n=1 Tax=Phytophthora aleatoria TaxID=2496075 RepID=A0A8J5JBN6_9STRA|nr:hypothetical protein JG688_00003083 [Phytophthora aleatoria]
MCAEHGGLTPYLQTGDIGSTRASKTCFTWRSTPGRSETKSSTLASETRACQASTLFASGSSELGATLKRQRLCVVLKRLVLQSNRPTGLLLSMMCMILVSVKVGSTRQKTKKIKTCSTFRLFG